MPSWTNTIAERGFRIADLRSRYSATHFTFVRQEEEAELVKIRRATENDRAAILECFVALQTHERSVEPNRADPADVAEAYVQQLWAQCADGNAEILVAEIGAAVVGWIGIVTQHISDDILEHDREFAYITDLIVMEGHRGRGIGHRLLAEAEAYGARKGDHRLRVGVLTANASAHEFYRSTGFRDYEQILEKRIVVPQGEPPERS